MKTIIINGSPRREGNTARMCGAFAEGVRACSPTASVETVRLYDLDYKGCRSCFACKRRGGPSYGRCAVKDALSPVLEAALGADILVLASPLYLMQVTGEMKSFLERLLYPVATYEAGYRSAAPRRMQVATIYTMNVPLGEAPWPQLAATEAFIGHCFSAPRRISAADTYQFDDYAPYAVEVFDEAHKRAHRDRVFPTELREAFRAGRELAERALRQAE